MELFLTEIELLLLDWQLDGPQVQVIWIPIGLLAVLIAGYGVMRYLLLGAKWSAAQQLFSQANIVVPPRNSQWVVGLVLGLLVLGLIWWALGP